MKGWRRESVCVCERERESEIQENEITDGSSSDDITRMREIINLSSSMLQYYTHTKKRIFFISHTARTYGPRFAHTLPTLYILLSSFRPSLFIPSPLPFFPPPSSSPFFLSSPLSPPSLLPPFPPLRMMTMPSVAR